MHTKTLLVLSAASAAGLAACGGGGALLSQEQATRALLTQEEFPLEGFTAGEVEEGVDEDTGGAAGDLLEDFPGADEFSDECVEALGALESMEADFSAQSTVEFTGDDPGASLFGAPSVQLIVASLEEGDNPLGMMESLNSACEQITLEEDGMSMTMEFTEVSGDAQGTTISVGVMGQTFELTVAGREDGGNYTVVTAMGVPDEDVIKVLDAQQEKIASSED